MELCSWTKGKLHRQRRSRVKVTTDQNEIENESLFQGSGKLMIWIKTLECKKNITISFRILHTFSTLAISLRNYVSKYMIIDIFNLH